MIIGFLVGMGAGLLGLLIKRVHYNQTRERLDANVEAVVGEAQLNRGCIPAQDNSSTPFGYCNDILRNRKDAWRNDFLCLVADEIAGYTGDCSACARKSTSLIVQDDMDGANHTDVAFVVVSGGPNMKIQTGIVSTSGNTTVHIYRPGEEVDGEGYDDLVRYVRLTELKTKLRCEYTEENLRILNNDFPSGYQGSSYDASVYAQGGVPFPGGEYEWCVEEGSPSFNATGIGYDCSESLSVSSNCSSATATWGRCERVDISGTPSSPGTYPLTFHVRDRENNEDRRSFVVSISSASPPPPCSSYQVKNVSGQDLAYNCSRSYTCMHFKKCYRNSGSPWPNGGLITISTDTNICDSRDSGCGFRSCYDYHPGITISAAQGADADRDCKVDYDGNRVREDSGW